MINWFSHHQSTSHTKKSILANKKIDSLTKKQFAMRRQLATASHPISQQITTQ